MDCEDVGEWIERENCSLYIGEEWIKFDAWSRYNDMVQKVC